MTDKSAHEPYTNKDIRDNITEAQINVSAHNPVPPCNHNITKSRNSAQIAAGDQVPADDHVSVGDQIPEGFKYKDIYLAGRPVHDRQSSFYARHPPMPASRWAKIFSPFDALKWFDERISEKEIQYTYKRLLSEDEQKELDRKLFILKDLTKNSHIARINKVQVTITYFVPCTDINNEAYGYKGQYRQLTGTVWNVDTELDGTIRINDTYVCLDDISEIDSIICASPQATQND